MYVRSTKMSFAKNLSKYKKANLGWRVTEAIAQYKKETGATNKELAELLNCNPGTVSKYLNGNQDMRLDSFMNVVWSLGLSVSELIKDTEWEGIKL